MVNPMGGTKITFKELLDSKWLTDRPRKMFLLRWNEDMTYKEIGKVFNLTKDSIHKHFKKISKIISRHCTRYEIFQEIFVKNKIWKIRFKLIGNSENYI